MRIVGLTGGIATGKSTVSKQLKESGLPVVDFDVIAKLACQKGHWGYQRVLKAFGADVLQPNGELDRDKLGRLVFADKAARKKLNGATHPIIFLEAIRELVWLWLTCNWLVIVDMPLLMEVGAHHLLRPCVVVTCSHAVEVERLMKRDGIDAARAEEKVAAQMPLSRKQQMADTVIDNSGPLAHTSAQVKQLTKQLQQGALLWGIVFSPIVFAAASASLLSAYFLQ